MTATDLDLPLATLGRHCWKTLEGIHILGYFAPEPTAAYGELGLKPSVGYFAARSAPLGAVPGQVVTATFYVFNPGLVEHCVAKARSVTTPEAVLEARHRSMAGVMRRVFKPAGVSAVQVSEVLELARAACEGLTTQGRSLYAGHASLPWPEDPLLALWHAATLVREHRGDGHIAALLANRLGPVEAMATYGASSGMTGFLKATRGWSEQEWSEAEQRCRDRGLLGEDGSLTEDGAALRASIEAQTNELAAEGWDHLGRDGTLRLRELLAPFRAALAATDVFPAGLLASK